MHHFLFVTECFPAKSKPTQRLCVVQQMKIEFKLKDWSATSVKGTVYLYEDETTGHYNGAVTIKLKGGEGMQLWSKCSLCCVKQSTSHLLTTTLFLSFFLSFFLS